MCWSWPGVGATFLSFDQTGNVPLPLAATVLALGNFLLIAAVFYCIWRLMGVYLTGRTFAVAGA
jgi:hypothetical protein